MACSLSVSLAALASSYRHTNHIALFDQFFLCFSLLSLTSHNLDNRPRAVGLSAPVSLSLPFYYISVVFTAWNQAVSVLSFLPPSLLTLVRATTVFYLFSALHPLLHSSFYSNLLPFP